MDRRIRWCNHRRSTGRPRAQREAMLAARRDAAERAWRKVWRHDERDLVLEKSGRLARFARTASGDGGGYVEHESFTTVLEPTGRFNSPVVRRGPTSTDTDLERFWLLRSSYRWNSTRAAQIEAEMSGREARRRRERVWTVTVRLGCLLLVVAAAIAVVLAVALG